MTEHDPFRGVPRRRSHDFSSVEDSAGIVWDVPVKAAEVVEWAGEDPDRIRVALDVEAGRPAADQRKSVLALADKLQ